MKHKIQLSGKGVVFAFILSTPAELVLSSADRDAESEASINRGSDNWVLARKSFDEKHHILTTWCLLEKLGR